MKITDKTKYAYVVTIVRAMESRMLNSGDVERMIEAKNAQEAYRVLNDLDYAEFLGDIENIEDFQVVINAGLKEVKDVLDQNTPKPEILDILWLRYDFHNLKVLLKAQIQEKGLQDVEHMLMPYGKYEYADLENLLNSPSVFLDSVEEKLVEAIKTASAIFEKEEDPTLIDVTFDKAYFEAVQELINGLQSEFLSTHQAMAIDVANIRTYLRCLALDEESLFAELFIKDGGLALNMFTGSMEEFGEKMQATKYGNIIDLGIKGYKETTSFLELEKAADSMLVDQLKEARYISLGIEPLFAFFWIKENNAQVIRTIMVNKLNNIAPVEIRKKVRKLYQ